MRKCSSHSRSRDVQKENSLAAVRLGSFPAPAPVPIHVVEDRTYVNYFRQRKLTVPQSGHLWIARTRVLLPSRTSSVR